MEMSAHSTRADIARCQPSAATMRQTELSGTGATYDDAASPVNRSSLLETSSIDAMQRTNGLGSGSCQPQARNDHQLHNSCRRDHNGYHLRGEFHSSYRQRRAQDKTNYERRHPPKFCGNGFHYQPRRPPFPMDFLEGPPPTLPPPFPMDFLEGPPPTLPPPFSVNPWPVMPPQFYCLPPPQPMGSPFAPLPLLPPPPPPPISPPLPFFLPDANGVLRYKILHQFRHFFSDNNLCSDVYLRAHMDDHGWILVAFMAQFDSIKALTSDINVIVETLQTSSLVEVQGYKVRKREDWKKWLLPPEFKRKWLHDYTINRRARVTLDEGVSKANSRSGVLQDGRSLSWEGRSNQEEPNQFSSEASRELLDEGKCVEIPASGECESSCKVPDLGSLHL